MPPVATGLVQCKNLSVYRCIEAERIVGSVAQHSAVILSQILSYFVTFSNFKSYIVLYEANLR